MIAASRSIAFWTRFRYKLPIVLIVHIDRTARFDVGFDITANVLFLDFQRPEKATPRSEYDTPSVRRSPPPPAPVGTQRRL